MAAMVSGERCFLSPIHCLDDGRSPSVELASFLSLGPQHDLAFAPKLAGVLEYARPRGEPLTLALLRRMVPGESDGLSHALDELGRYFDRALAGGIAPKAPPANLLSTAMAEDALADADALGSYGEGVSLLGRRIAELHAALGSEANPAAFAPEPFTLFDQRSFYQSMRNMTGQCLRLLREQVHRLPTDAAPVAERVLGLERLLLERFAPLLHLRMTAHKIRHHGAFTLERVAWTGNDYVVVDHDGDRYRQLSERRRKGLALRDVTRMVRSHFVAANLALENPGRLRPEDAPLARVWADVWWTNASVAFLRGYLTESRGAVFLPERQDELEVVFDALLLESGLVGLRAAFELHDDEGIHGEANRAVPMQRVVIALRFLAWLFAPTLTDGGSRADNSG
jgi:maltose alpha-D-glucosyltransferase/alpha-amylase